MLERISQRLEGLVALDLAQPLRCRETHAVKRIVVQRVLELLQGIALAAHLLNREQASEHVALVRELRVEHRGRGSEGDFRQQRHPGIDAHALRRFRQRDIEVLRLVLHVQHAVHDAGLGLESNRQRHVEEQHVVAQALHLLDGELRQLRPLIPGVGDIQLGMMRVIDVLVEELIKRTSAQLLDHLVQVLGDHAPVLMTLQVGLDAAAIEILTELTAEHVENPASLGIRVKAELILRRVEVAPHDGVRVVGHGGDALEPRIHHVEKGVVAILVFLVERLVVSRETLVQPQVRPVLAGDEIPEPLMHQLMRHQPLAFAQVLRRVREQRTVVQDGERRVLHAAPAEILHADLVILRPGIRHADFLLEETHHVLRVTEGSLRVVDLRSRRPERHRDVAIRVGDGFEIPGAQRDEIIRVRLVLQPAHRHETGGVLRLLHAFAVGEHHHALGHMADHFAGELLIRRIEAGKPMPRLQRLALRPQVLVARRITHLLRAEIKAVLRRRAVGDRDRRLLVRWYRLREREHHLLVRRLPAQQLRG